ncbi:hypothetical protein A6R68_00659, partial [Neotoma lepida]
MVLEFTYQEELYKIEKEVKTYLDDHVSVQDMMYRKERQFKLAMTFRYSRIDFQLCLGKRAISHSGPSSTVWCKGMNAELCSGHSSGFASCRSAFSWWPSWQAVNKPVWAQQHRKENARATVTMSVSKEGSCTCLTSILPLSCTHNQNDSSDTWHIASTIDAITKHQHKTNACKLLLLQVDIVIVHYDCDHSRCDIQEAVYKID